MAELKLKSDIGVQSAGEKINWRYLNEERVDDPVISALMKEAETIYINESTLTNINLNYENLHLYVESFNKFLKDQKLKFAFTNEVPVEKKAKKMTSKELLLQKIKTDKNKVLLDTFISSLTIINNMPLSFKDPLQAFLNVVFWALSLLKNKNENISYYLNCAISLHRAINDSKSFLSSLIINESIELLNTLESYIYSKNSSSIFSFISNNLNFISDSFWDKEKPQSIVLYEEQKNIVSLIISKLVEKFIILFEMPPANGKTILSAIIAKIIAHKNINNLKTIPGYTKKTILYICYNTIVRNEVAKLCITHNVDVKYWLAVNKLDDVDGITKTFLRPYKTCYPDWNNRSVKYQRTKKEQKAYDETKWKKFSSNIHDQMEFFLYETRLMSQKNKVIYDFDNAENLPEMIISDLDSAYILLKEFPDMFIAYFDEAFAASKLEITAKIMSVLNRAVLVSATLAKQSEIPTVITDFKTRHNLLNDDFVYSIKSNKQHISCTFIDPNGNMFPPHENVSNLDELHSFIELLDKPLIKRAYSPEVVFSMSNKINSYLPEELKFRTRFPYFGVQTHETIREYACDILKYIDNTSNIELFNNLKFTPIKKLINMDINSIFTQSSIFYQGSKTLHVASSNNFNQHIENIAKPFLDLSPKLSDLFTSYQKDKNSLDTRIANIDENSTKKNLMEDTELISELSKTLANLQLKWPMEFILNSADHANKFGNGSRLNAPNIEIRGSIDELNVLDEIRAKLFLSGIGIYQPETFSSCKMDLFLRNKDNFKFILSTPSIVYGTNINLSIIDIDSSFVSSSTKNTLYQLIGRAGRRGKSQSATIVFRDMAMLNIILQLDDNNVEAIQIESNYQKILLEK